MANKLYEESDIQAIATSIRGKNGSSDTYTVAQMANAIDNIPSGGGGLTSKGVDFCDYDGTILYTYTIAEAQALSALPALPTMQGFTCQGWNFTLAQVQATTENMVIGLNYTPTTTRTSYIDIEITDIKDNIMYLYFQNNSDDYNITINWGDNNTSTAYPGGLTEYSHNYNAIGTYRITLSSTKNSAKAQAGSTYGLFGATEEHANRCSYKVKNAFIGTVSYDASGFENTDIETFTCDSSLGLGSFKGCKKLKFLTIRGASIPSYFLSDCINVKITSFPSTITSMRSTNCFSKYCASEELIIPNTITTLASKDYAFQSCTCTKIIFKGHISTIAQGTFSNCSRLYKIDFTACTSVPTLNYSNAFNELPSDCKIVVPDSLYASWITASNWSTIASQIVSESNY